MDDFYSQPTNSPQTQKPSTQTQKPSVQTAATPKNPSSNNFSTTLNTIAINTFLVVFVLLTLLAAWVVGIKILRKKLYEKKIANDWKKTIIMEMVVAGRTIKKCFQPVSKFLR
jgi:hypothetical protein